MKDLLVSGENNVVFFNWLVILGLGHSMGQFGVGSGPNFAMGTHLKKRQKLKRGTYE